MTFVARVATIAAAIVLLGVIACGWAILMDRLASSVPWGIAIAIAPIVVLFAVVLAKALDDGERS